jgi:hypothetical protein
MSKYNPNRKFERFWTASEALTGHAYLSRRSADFTMKKIYGIHILEAVIVYTFGNFYSTQWPLQHIYTCFVSASAIGSNIWPGFPSQNARACQKVSKWGNFNNFWKLLMLLRSAVWQHSAAFSHWDLKHKRRNFSMRCTIASKNL